ncbi:MAG TPA: hypothetical protein VGW38_02380 [Chloroflexota bacterium]|nr:hypothetical protein [Chloroflexota bacterium]
MNQVRRKTVAQVVEPATGQAGGVQHRVQGFPCGGIRDRVAGRTSEHKPLFVPPLTGQQPLCKLIAFLATECIQRDVRQGNAAHRIARLGRCHLAAAARVLDLPAHLQRAGIHIDVIPLNEVRAARLS